MRVCPQCSAQYADDTLSFCLNDGTPLANGPQPDTPTVVLGETETFVARSSHASQPSGVTRVQTFEQPGKSSNTVLAVVATAFGMLIVFGIIGLGTFLYVNSGQQPVANADTNVSKPPTTRDGNFNASSPVTNTATSTSPMPTAPMPPSNTNTDTRPPVVPDDGQTKNEVSQRVYGWKSSLEAGNLDAYMDNYASTLDYYTRSGVSRSSVRADKARAFSRYGSKRVNVSNMVVTSDGPSSATATFDKEWTFSGEGSSSGKVRSQLKFEEIGGRWLIVSERDIRVYYTR